MTKKEIKISEKNRLIKDTPFDKAFMVLVYIFLALILLICAYPLVYVLSASFSSPNAVTSGKVWLFPVDVTLMGYEAVFKNQQLMTGFANSLLYMVVGTVINLFMTMCCAFPLSRKEFYGRGIFTTIFVFTMYFGGGLVPSYMLINNLGLLNSRWVMVIPTAMSVWNVILARTYLQSTIPDELFEAAQLDGCSEINFLLKIVIPLSAPILAVLALYYGVGHWNSYFHAMIYLNEPGTFPLQVVLRNILILGKIDPLTIKDVDALTKKQGLSELLKYAVIVVASVPVLMIYPFVQKYFVKGVMIGALKG